MDVKSQHTRGACRQRQRRRGLASRDSSNSLDLLLEHDLRPLIRVAEEYSGYFLKDAQQRWPAWFLRLAVRSIGKGA